LLRAISECGQQICHRLPHSGIVVHDRRFRSCLDLEAVEMAARAASHQLGAKMLEQLLPFVRFDGYFGPYIIFEPGAAYMRIKTNLGSRNYLLPELSLQAQGYVGEKIRPFIGGGLGFANIATGANENQFTLHAVTGVRIHLGGPWGLRLEARARSVDPWHGHTLDFTAGIMRVVPTGM